MPERFNSNLNSLLPGPLQNSMLKYKAMPTIPSCLKQIVEQPQTLIARLVKYILFIYYILLHNKNDVLKTIFRNIYMTT